MPNMSYCRFGNTLDDLQDCRDAMIGMDHYYQSRDDISEDEFNSMKQIIKICRDIVKITDNGNNVFLDGGGEDEDS